MIEPGPDDGWGGLGNREDASDDGEDDDSFVTGDEGGVATGDNGAGTTGDEGTGTTGDEGSSGVVVTRLPPATQGPANWADAGQSDINYEKVDW